MRISKQNKIVVGVIAFILALTVGYALFSESLNINGTAKASGDFGLEFVSVDAIRKEGYTDTSSNGSASEEEIKQKIASIVDVNGKKNSGLNVTVDKLNYPGAYVEIDTTIKNVGTIDAILKGIEITSENGTVNDKTISNDDIEITYTGVNENDVMKADENDSSNTRQITIKVKWKESSANKSPAALTFNIGLNFEQATGNLAGGTTGGDLPSENLCTQFEKKDTYNIGDLIALCNDKTGVSEDFYVIKDNGDTVTMLSKYNLLVGNIVENFDGESGTVNPIDEATQGYGLQNSEAKGILIDKRGNLNPRIVGAIGFENLDQSSEQKGYWTDVNENLLEKYGSSYPANVYSDNQLLKGHVNNYVSYINNTINKKSVTGRLITYEELIELGCNTNNEHCPTDKSWLYQTSYWTSSVQSHNRVYSIYTLGDYSTEHIQLGSYILGIRPVIEISKADI